MNIALDTAPNRMVVIHHLHWDARWMLQFPESIVSLDGWLLDYPPIEPQWRRDGDTLSYTWISTQSYVAEMHALGASIPHFAEKRFLSGFQVEATVRLISDGVALSLRCSNRTSVPLRSVHCDGGCFQAHHPSFAGPNEVARTHLLAGGQLKSLAALPRSVPERCMYHDHPSLYDEPPTNEGEWFWGRSTVSTDYPALLAMISSDQTKAVAIGYQHAHSISANADHAHHCMHSRPRFGDIAPGQSVERRGAIIFAPTAAQAIDQLHQHLAHCTND